MFNKESSLQTAKNDPCSISKSVTKYSTETKIARVFTYKQATFHLTFTLGSGQTKELVTEVTCEQSKPDNSYHKEEM